MFGMLPHHVPRMPRDPYEIMESARSFGDHFYARWAMHSGATEVRFEGGVFTVTCKTRVPKVERQRS